MQLYPGMILSSLFGWNQRHCNPSLTGVEARQVALGDLCRHHAIAG